jgi:hypothetical protein
MFESHPRSGSPPRRLLVTIALVVASAGAGFAIGRHPDIGKGAQAASRLPAASPGNSAAPSHDGSLPDTADTLGNEKPRDEEGAPTF